MTTWYLVRKEIGHRRVNFGLSVLAVVVAIACLVGVLVSLRKHDLHTQELVTAKQRETEARLAELADDYRKMTVRMGFNVLILPEDQNLANFYAEDFASHTMPEAYVERLADSDIVTIQHLLPSLQRKVTWPERQRTVILIGTRGEVPYAHRAPKQPILPPVPPGTVVLGYELHSSMGLTTGQVVSLMGREFTVSGLHPQRGTKDDITLWIDLGEAQELLGMQGRINGILALECNCAAADVGKVREEIAAILPDTQVIESSGKALARAEARRLAAVEADAAVAAIARHRAALRSEQERFAAFLVPLAVVVSAVLIGVLALGNVRERRFEIGLLRAIGVRARGVLVLFLSRAALVGVIGGVFGCAVGLLVGSIIGEHTATRAGAGVLGVPLLCAIMVAAPLLAMMAAWLPAVLAAQQDPADILREE
jgi:hypothetical protein